MTFVHATVCGSEALEASLPLLVLITPQGDTLPASLAALDAAHGGAAARAWAAGDFRGKKDELFLAHPASGAAARLLLVGAGAVGSVGRLRRAAAAAAKRARVLGAPSAVLVLADELVTALGAKVAGQAVGEGVPYGAWHFAELKRPPEEPKPALADVRVVAPAARAEFEAGLAVGTAVGLGQSFARRLQMLPGNTCTPTFLGQQAEVLAARWGFGCTVLDDDAMRAEGMHALLAVGQGSAEPSRFIALEYKGAEGAPVVLVGKGVSFDTGGISLKPGEKMEDMKFDMSGAAAVFGTFEMLGRLRPKVNVVGLVASAENMPSGTAVKPGDVIGSHFGKTIEMINTDAEGRLLLCDALSYARRYQPAAVLDIATLTGAIVVALGHVAAGLYAPDSALEAEVRAAAERADERVWPLPTWDDYRDLMKSDIADVKNSGGRAAGSISASWFLREFVEGFPWAHLDIAGTAYSDREDATRVKGPTGMGVRLFSEFVLARAR